MIYQILPPDPEPNYPYFSSEVEVLFLIAVLGLAILLLIIELVKLVHKGL